MPSLSYVSVSARKAVTCRVVIMWKLLVSNNLVLSVIRVIGRRSPARIRWFGLFWCLMSNNLVSHFPLPNRQVVSMEHTSTPLNLPTSEMQMRVAGQVPNNDLSHHFALSNEQMGVAEPMSSNLGFQNVLVPNNKVGQNELVVGINGSNAFWMPSEQGHDGALMQNIQAGEKSLLLSKRKAEGGPEQYNFVPQQSLIPNKRAIHMGANINSPGLRQLAPQKKTAPMQSNLSSPGLQNQPLPNKKMVRNESMSSKSGGPRGQNMKRQTSLIQSGSKVQTESSEAIRLKMRESLADALSLAFQKPDKVANAEEKQTDAANINQAPVECQSSESNLSTATPIPGSKDISPLKELATAGKPSNCQVLSAEFPTHESSGNDVQAFREFHYGTILPDEDVSFSENFFVKDDLLQGNGLSWALDFDVEVREGKEAQNSEKSLKEEYQGAGNRGELGSLTPTNLAFKIEEELFKVFGGVNKKYKEKGRSLLFNLKDRNNPELRERVVSGEISPERLCSMSAEELASKELSEWRMAKAEEMAQMVVLPDTDIRRLVKKTHKGEYQVEVERDYSMAAEVSAGTNVSTQHKPRKETETHSPSKLDNNKDRENVAGLEKNSENQDFQGSLVIPTDGTDLMQGMMVDDELKDVDFLPPIVSLDEFMESLNSEPPFDNIPADADKTSHILSKESPEEVNNSKALISAAENSTHTPSKKVDESVSERKVDVAVPSNSSSAVQKGLPSGDASEIECLWEGVLQLNISSLVTVGGQFQSGEKTSTKEWPSSLEIKGRVRLDAFEKFFRELPMSRTRAVMILHFILKNKQSENERTAVSEAVDSYVAEDRLGFAEPAPGVELYLCPPSSKMLEMLSEHHSKMANIIDDGLIGVVVWRRRHISNTISPNSSSHHKHSSKKQPFAAHLKEGQNSNNNKNTSVLVPVSYKIPTRSNPKPKEEEDDDIPPGFGPVAAARAAKDDDDLPEFNFSGDVKPSVPGAVSQNLHRGVKMTTSFNQNPQLPVDQVRELIQKYGQTETSSTNRNWVDNKDVGIEPWKDDDDDIPEWRPNAPSSAQPPLHGFRPSVHRPLVNHHVIPPVARAPPANPSGLASWPPGARSVHPAGRHPGARWRH
ncbi:unnamed protein product [Fraxinus pennsylvanica]|uniref:TFIIS central domain-containing protein n=1 Tax=Fraxinus pennsylvanica TaxID=56036 RepID=A0AAD1ZKW2_9LAMI|nr:unnamed protein product [Fraxinus pennsylvanica]